MPRDLRLYLEDVRDACRTIIRFTEDMTLETFRNDERTRPAVERCLFIIGEAVKSVPDDLRVRYPEVPRRRIAGLRDFLGHVYFAINLNILWQVTSINVPELLPQIERILDVEFGDGDLGSAPSG